MFKRVLFLRLLHNVLRIECRARDLYTHCPVALVRPELH